MESRADLHVHSKHSDRPSEWLLRRLGSPESFTEPREVYRLCRERGMSFVTLSDHDTIAGALEIAHLPGVFVSCEVTTRFPEDGCKIHCLVFGLDEGQHRDIQRLRDNIYELRDYLLAENLAHSVAHPLYSVNNRLTVEHVEKLLVLFKRFEGINGGRAPRAAQIFQAIVAGLTPESIAALAERHRLDPRDPEPWRKYLTAGSDDHGGLYVASAFTATPPAASVDEFLAHLRAGRHTIAGEHGSSLKLARSFCAIASTYYQSRLQGRGRPDVLGDLLRRFAEDDPGAPSGGERLRRALHSFVRPRAKEMGRVDRQIAASLAGLASLRGTEPSTTTDQRVFQEASRLADGLAYAALRKLVKHARRGRLTESLQSLSSLVPAALCAAPYLAAFHTQHKDEKLLRAAAERFPAAGALRDRSARRIWFTDTLAESNGLVARHVAALAERLDLDLEVVTSAPEAADAPPVAARCFTPVGTLPLHGWAAAEIALPPFLEILEHCERAQVNEVVLGSPGPMGLAGLLAGRLLGARVVAIWDTDLAPEVRRATDSEWMEDVAWRYLRWFFGQADRVWAASAAEREELAARGLDTARLRALARDGEPGPRWQRWDLLLERLRGEETAEPDSAAPLGELEPVLAAAAPR